MRGTATSRYRRSLRSHGDGAGPWTALAFALFLSASAPVVIGAGVAGATVAARDSDLKVSVPVAAEELRQRLSALPGVELTDRGADYRLERLGDRWIALTGEGEALFTTKTGTPQGQYTDDIVHSIGLRARLRRLLSAATERSAGLKIEAGSTDQAAGGTIRAHEGLNLVLRSSSPVTVSVFQVMGDGSTHVWVPADPGDPSCRADPRLPAQTPSLLCSWRGAAPPYGLDLVYILALEGDSPPLARVSDRELNDALLSRLEDLVAHHPGRVAMLEKAFFTAGRRGD
jgi:hypothetical protein